jgi:hypothetical protein
LDSPKGSGKISFSFQVQDQVPLIGDVQLVVIQDLNTARNCRFRHDSNDCFRRQRKEACCSIGAEAEDPERLRYSECFRCHALQLFSLERRFVSPARFADFGRSSCGSDKSPGDLFNCLSGLLASSLVMLFSSLSWGRVNASGSQVQVDWVRSWRESLRM